jgi:hypothetical protein
MSLNVTPFSISVTENAPVAFHGKYDQASVKDCLKVEGNG